jgi:ornithine cyclodeaminase/alanine dehydrogenase-like protein (mu-crystallin family)
MIRVVSAALAKSLLPMVDAIEVNVQAFMQFHRGGVVNPDRLVVMLGVSLCVAVLPVLPALSTLFQMEVISRATETVGHTLVKPAHVPETGAFGLKVVSVFPTNSTRGLPTVPGVIMVMNDTTGMLEGIVDGTYVTALRTAAGSGAATRMLARPDAKKLVVFGAGAQAASHVSAMLVVRPIESVVVVSRSVEAGFQFLATQLPPDTHITASAIDASDPDAVHHAVASADVICMCTSSSVPLFDGAWLSPGTHINAVGSYRPTAAELDSTTMTRAYTVLDTNAAMECGEIHMNLASGAVTTDVHIRGTLGGLLCGDVVIPSFDGAPGKPVRNIVPERGVFSKTFSSCDLRLGCFQDVTLFKSVGVAFQDVATAHAILKKANVTGVGVTIEL